MSGADAAARGDVAARADAGPNEPDADVVVAPPPDGATARDVPMMLPDAPPPDAASYADAPSTPPDAPAPRPAGRSGLHFTPAELAIWRERAARGPYRVRGDVSPNSPGDWTRIQSNALQFLRDPSAARYAGPTGVAPGSCIPTGAADGLPEPAAAYIRDAAFVYLLHGDTRYRDAVRRELVAQAAERGMDMSDRTRWCPRVLSDTGPEFPLAIWLTTLYYAFDYVGDDAFTPAELASVRRFFANAAHFMREVVDNRLDNLFRDRQRDDYTVVSAPNFGRIGYYGSPPTGTIARHYNNRRAITIRFAALVGVKQGIPQLAAAGARFVRDWITYSVYPQGFFGEFERWVNAPDSLPGADLGWSYATAVLSPIITIVDALARAGDNSLYEFTTRAGAHGTECRAGDPDKSLRFALQAMGRYLDGTYRRYGTDRADRLTNEYLIDGQNVSTRGTWRSLADLGHARANMYYRDDYLRGIYLRTGRGLAGYPSSSAGMGFFSAEQGDWGSLPGALFMFGQMETLVDPYPRR